MNPVSRARAALDALAEAMLSGNPDNVLSHEMAVAAAAADLSRLARTCAPASIDDVPAFRAELYNLRASLDRCRALGAVTADLSAVLFAAPTGYSSSGTLRAAAVSMPFFSTRS